MLSMWRNTKGQVIASEYLITFFIVASVGTAMSVYFRRAIQGRMRDAHRVMVHSVIDRTQGYYNNRVYLQYEPYYLDTETLTRREITTTDEMAAGGSTGIFTRTHNAFVNATIVSETAPPKDRD